MKALIVFDAAAVSEWMDGHEGIETEKLKEGKIGSLRRFYRGQDETRENVHERIYLGARRRDRTCKQRSGGEDQ